MRNVIVIGAGVIGLTSGIRLREAGFQATIWSADDAPSTTSYAAGASWGPHFVPITSATTEWGLRTLAVHRAMADDPATGVRIGTGIEVSDDPDVQIPAWAEPLGEIERVRPPGFAGGWRHRTPLIDMPAHLAYLRQRFLELGGSISQQRVESFTSAFEQVGDAVLVNCTGMGAAALAGDTDLTPVRGQVVIVANPGISEFFVDGRPTSELTYYFPHGDIVLLGGQSIVGVWSRDVDPAAAAAMIKRCAAIEPRLRDATVLEYRVGLRPYRPSGVRLEAEGNGDRTLIHNYGHGGAGVTLSWGCADEVVNLVGAALVGTAFVGTAPKD